MSDFTRKIKRRQDLLASKATKSAELTDEQKRLPSGRITTAPLRGTHPTIPLIAWISKRKSEEVPLVMLALALLGSDGILGVMHVELPVYKGETDAATVAALQRYGWQGGIWKPGDESWPTGDEVTVEQLTTLIQDTQSLKATLTFPPIEDGVCVQEVEIGRAQGSFLMPPLPEPEVPNEALIARLHELCDDYTCFYLDAVIPANRKTN